MASQVTDATATEYVRRPYWAQLRPGMVAHFVMQRPRSGYWHSPCGRSPGDLGPALDPTTIVKCGRCVTALSREPSRPRCTGCELLTCPDCNKPTEARMLEWLRQHYAQAGGGNGDRFMFARHVRSRAGFDARTADAVVMDLWQSKGLQLHGHEIKVSRADWQNELRDPDKWRGVGRYMDRWWVTVSDATIVRKEELLPQWGLMVVGPLGTKILRRAPLLDPQPMDRSFLAALVRAAAKTGQVA